MRRKFGRRCDWTSARGLIGRLTVRAIHYKVPPRLSQSCAQEKSVVLRSSRARSVQKVVTFLLLALATAQTALAVANFSPQRRVGYNTGDQWEPALAADGHGHIYILFPQYGAVSDCPACTAPTIALMVSNDDGISWQAARALV